MTIGHKPGTWYAKNRQRHAEYGKRYEAKHKDEMRAYRAEWKRQNAGRVRATNWASYLMRQYGLSIERWTQMLIEQRGRCWLCGRPMMGPRDPAVDHDHQTNEIRGLAHDDCNVAFGRLGEDPDLIYELAQRALELRHPRLKAM